MKTLMAAVLVLLAPAAPAVESRDARGLRVALERIAEPLVVDGIVMHVQRAQGPDIPRLAGRIEQRWRAEGSQMQRSGQGGWQVLGRWVRLRSEVIQWRGTGDAAELVFSWFDAARRPASRTAAPLMLPPSCEWVRSVEGQTQASRYLQMTARCRAAPAELLARLEATLVRSDWAVLHKGQLGWDVARRNESARITVVPAATADESALVWVGTTADVDP